MTYQIHGAQNFRQSADSASAALTFAKSANTLFPPVRIVGPDGEITLSELSAKVEAEKRNAQKS